MSAGAPGTNSSKPGVQNDITKYFRFGISPRGAQSLVLASKVSALLDRRINLSFEDIRANIKQTLRHRLILSYEADAEGVDADAIVRRAMAKDLEQRYATWEEFSLDLAQVFRGEPIGAREQDFADSDKFETLRSLPFFEKFTDAEIWEVARISTWHGAKAGEVLMKEGESGPFFCILAEGQIKVTKRNKLLKRAALAKINREPAATTVISPRPALACGW